MYTSWKLAGTARLSVLGAGGGCRSVGAREGNARHGRQGWSGTRGTQGSEGDEIGGEGEGRGKERREEEIKNRD
eukprot:6205548-Pleurochrysis_carterae.AAC.1